MKKVLLMCFGNDAGGMELDCFKTAKLLSLEANVHCLVKEGSFLSSFLASKGMGFSCVKFKSGLSRELYKNICKLVTELHFDNIILFGVSEVKTLFFIKKKFPRINIVLRHGTTKQKSKKDFIHKIFHSCVDTHIVISKHLKQNVEEIFPISTHSKIKLIYPHIEINDRSDERKLYSILHVGRIAGGKGQLDLIQAVKKLKRMVQVDFYGEVVDQDIFATMKKIKTQSMHIHGFSENIQDEYISHQVFVLPSSGEGLGKVTLEALGSGCVVIIYDNTTANEFKELGLYMHVVEDGNIDSLSKAIEIVLNNIDTELSRANNNIDLVRAVFSREREKKELLEILC